MKKLDDLIEEFKQQKEIAGISESVADLADTDKAWANCGEATAAFNLFLKERDLESQKVCLFGLPQFVVKARQRHFGKEMGEDDMDEEELYGPDLHWINCANGVFIDWTGRQYRPDVAFPYIATKRQLRKEGWSLYLMRETLDRACFNAWHATVCESFNRYQRNKGPKGSGGE